MSWDVVLSRGMPFVKILLGVALAIAVHLAAMVLAGIRAGGTLKEVSLGIGPVLRRFHVRGATWMVRLIPVNGYVQFWRRPPARDEEDREPAAPEGVVLWDDLPGIRRAAAQLAGPSALLAVGAALLGSAPWLAAWDGAKDGVRGALSPLAAGPALLGEALAAARDRSFVVVLGLVFVKVAGLNLLPLPSFNGGAALLDLITPRGAPWSPARRRIAVLGLLLGFAMFTSWIVALVVFLTR
jgi:membrane-associated protease RseP (regulator of RpoE activity)